MLGYNILGIRAKLILLWKKKNYKVDSRSDGGRLQLRACRDKRWPLSPDALYLATGMMAGAVDLSFSYSTNLEIF